MSYTPMDIKANSKGKQLSINEDTLTDIKIELKGVWTLYIIINRCLRESW